MKIVKQGKEAQQALKKGIDKVANAVASTYGPKGRNVIIDEGYRIRVTNDGITVAQSIELEDEAQNAGAKAFMNVARETNDIVGDGTTTAVIIAHSLITEHFGCDNPMQMRDDINRECQRVIKKIKPTPIKSDEEIERIASISSESKEIGAIIASAFKKVGVDGMVKVEDSDETEIELEMSKGLEFPKGYVSPHMVTDLAKETAEIKDVPILITDSEINSIHDILPLIEKLANSGNNKLVIMSDKVSHEVLSTVILNKIQGKFTILLINTSGVAQRRSQLEDLATMCGTTVITVESGVALKDTTISHLGKIEKIVATKDKTTIINDINIDKAIISLKKLYKETKDDTILERIAKLSNGVAIIKVGATTEQERNYLRDKIDDAVNATKAAIEEGIVKGGGLTLKEIADDMRPNVLSNALRAPYHQIMHNAGVSFEISDDVIDPAKVVRVALEKACSIAGIILTSDTLIVKKNEKND